MNKQVFKPKEAKAEHGYFVPDYGIDSLVGKIMTSVEALGLPNKQEEAVKSIMKGHIYDETYRSDNVVHVPSQISTCLYEMKWALNKQGGWVKDCELTVEFEQPVSITATPA